MRKCSDFAIPNIVLVALLLGGCVVGPSTIPRDRFQYGDAVAGSWKEQTLLNMVKSRYHDPPTFMSINQVVNQYSLERRLGVGGDVLDAGRLGETFSVDGSAIYYDRPTITYSPRTGDRFTADILTPVTPHALLSLVESGWSVSLIFRLAVEVINGIDQVETDDQAQPMMNPEFEGLLAGLEELQTERLVSIRLRREDDETSVLLVIRNDDEDEEHNEIAAAIRGALNLRGDTDQYSVVFGSTSRSNTEIAMQTRSILEIMNSLGRYVNVPDTHIAEEWAMPGVRESGTTPISEWPFRVHSGEEAPEHAFTSIRYEDHYFWIDKGDLQTKRLLAAFMLLTNVAESPTRVTAPLVTIPAG